MNSEPPASSASDERELVTRLRSGDNAAWETAVRTQGGRMLAVTRRLLRDDDDAGDAVQDAFISAYKAIDRFEGGSRLSTWLHRIAVNAALMKIRSQKRRPETSIEDLLPDFLEDGHHRDMPRPWKLSAHELLERDETRRTVRDLIDRLPDDYRTVLLLRDIEELDTRETADMLGITPNAAKIRLHRARIALRTLLDRHVMENSAR